MESSFKKARVNVSEVLHEAFLVTAAPWCRFQTVARMARERSSDGNTSSGSQSHLVHLEETRSARLCPAVTVRARGQKTKGKALPRILLVRWRLLVLWFLDTLIEMCCTFAETHQQHVVKPSMSCWLSVPTRDEKSEFC